MKQDPSYLAIAAPSFVVVTVLERLADGLEGQMLRTEVYSIHGFSHVFFGIGLASIILFLRPRVSARVVILGRRKKKRGRREQSPNRVRICSQDNYDERLVHDTSMVQINTQGSSLRQSFERNRGDTAACSKPGTLKTVESDPLIIATHLSSCNIAPLLRETEGPRLSRDWRA